MEDITEQDLRLTAGLPGSDKSEVKADTSVKATATPSTKQASTSVSAKKENATLEQRIDILDWHHKNGGESDSDSKALRQHLSESDNKAATDFCLVEERDTMACRVGAGLLYVYVPCLGFSEV